MEDLVTKYTMKTGNNWGSGVLVMNSKDEILVGLRTDTHNYCTPGGKVGVGETAEQGLRREIKEETALTSYSLIFVDTVVKAFSNEKVWCNFLFIAKNAKGTPKPQLSELSELKWVTPIELKKLELFEPTRLLLDKCKEKKLIKWW